MAARKPPSQQPTAANLSSEQMRSAIPKLERRIRDLEEFNPNSLTQRGDPRLDSIENKLKDTVAEVFGHGTLEYNRFQPRSLDTAGYNMIYETPLRDVIQSVQESREREILNLKTIIELFHEKLEDGGESSVSKARRAFGDLDLHPEISRACSKLFSDGHYAEAVENSCKVLDMLVKMRSMRMDPSGTELMQLVFSPKSPILKFNEQQNDSERSEQQGMMFLFSGAMLAIRNPRAHGLVQDNPENAVAYISFISMLAKSLDRTSP
ncbi:TIGR02391 family protein [Lysobacter sp. K5869]|uniref:TIGR02391 family protein n=1 Tax=Lysobacter sp. K5869 TaxID=2820808 RepID=UPI001C05F8D8|nr:TIGR02391 family protein [Lysobacter sp. K5869]QWP78319.1 TIGR02391 family protein [Lysobacter sp. K5869]